MNRNIKCLVPAISGIAIALPLASAAIAQDRGTELEEIVVTATRRELNVQSLAESIAAFSERDIVNAGADNFASLTGAMAGVELRNAQQGTGNVAVRGVSELNAENLYGSTGAAVGFYLDEMPLTMAGQFPDMKAFDMQRIEVLKGPQGTLYGEGSMAGTVRMIAARPDASAFGAKVDGTWSTTEEGDDNTIANAMINVPIIDDELALRVVGGRNSMGGWIDNVQFGTGTLREEDANSSDSTNLRASLAWTPSEQLRITATYTDTDLELDGRNVGTDDLYRATSVDEPTDDELQGYNLTVEYDFGSAKLVSSTSYFDRSVLSVIDQGGLVGIVNLVFGAFGVPAIDGVYIEQSIDVDATAQEVRLVSENAGPINWTVGVFYKDQDFTYGFPGLTVPVVPASVWEQLSSILLGTPISEGLNIATDSGTEQYAVFGELNWDIADCWHLVVGGRYFEEDRDSFTAWGGLFPVLLGGPLPGSAESEGDDSLFKPRISLRYDVGENAMVYATYAEGFRSGGQNDLYIFVPGSDFSFDSEELSSYEVGLKSQWLDNRVQLNAAAYYMQWQNLQAVVGEGPGGLGEVVGNIGDAHTQGLDVELKAIVFDGLQLSVAGNLLEAETDDDALVADPAGGPGSLVESGTRIPGSAEQTLALMADYSFPVTADVDGFARISYSYVGNALDQLTRDVQIPSYETLGARIGVGNERWQITLFGENLTDEFIATNLSPVPDSVAGVEQWTIARPRTIGLNVRYEL